MQEDTYKTLANKSESYFKDKSSKFYGFAYPVKTENDVKTILDEIKKKFFDARHHCYAYSLGVDKNCKYRINDDGEPSSSAGRPIYGQIQSYQLTDVLIVVVRYFGGIKLGIPGLINAYKTAAKEAIDNNQIVEKIITSNAIISCKYENVNLAMKFIKDENLNVISQDYDNDKLNITVEIRNSKLTLISEKINAIYGLELIK